MTARAVAITLILALVAEPALALRPTGPEESEASQRLLLDALTAGMEEESPRIHVADDPTGGAELAGEFSKSGEKVLLVTRDTARTLLKGYPHIVYSTGTRNVWDRREVERRVAAVRDRPLRPGERSYLKMDSTLRGPWLDLLLARAKRLRPELILIAPALPSQGRVTRQGVHGFLKGERFVPLHEGSLYLEQMDPALVAFSDLLGYVQKHAPSVPVALLDLERIERGKHEVLQFLREASPGTAVVADAMEQRHLETIASAVKELRRPILCCGSAGLFGALVASPDAPPGAVWLDQLRQSHPGTGKVLVIAGSRHERSLLQIRWALHDMPDSIAVVRWAARVASPRGAIQRAWRRARTVILQLEPYAMEALREGRIGMHRHLRGILQDAGLREELSLLVVFGGDTLDGVLTSCRAGFAPSAKVSLHIPYGQMIGPGQPPLPMVSKAGGFGPPVLLRDLLRQARAVEPPRLVVTMGDPAGTGPELLLRALAEQPDLTRRARLLVVGDAKVLALARRMFHLPLAAKGVTLRSIRRASDARFAPGVLNILDLRNVDPALLARTFGPVGTRELDEATRRHLGRAALEYLDAGIELVSAGEADGLVTLPVTKEEIARVEPGFRGHTERLGEKMGTLSGSGDVTITLIHGGLRVLHVTTHLSLAEVVEAFRDPGITDRILELIRVADQMGRRYFGIRNPRIGVLGLNPHAGEGSLLGTEERERIQPAIHSALQEGLNVNPEPIPGDTAFTPGVREQYDFLIAMSHDQGHGPFKAIAGFEGINFTGNLAKVRTTPDHGTDRVNAYNPERTQQPTAQGVIAALRSAVEMVSAERSSSAGLEEGGGMDRREFLKSMAAAWLEAEAGLLSRLLGESDPDLTSAIRFFVSLTGRESELLWAEEFDKSPERVVDAWVVGVKRVVQRRAPHGVPSPKNYPLLADEIIRDLREEIAANRRQLEHLPGEAIVEQQELLPPEGLTKEDGLVYAWQGYGNLEDLLGFWRALYQDVLSVREENPKALQAKGASPSEIREAQWRLGVTRTLGQRLQEFAQLPRESQGRILQYEYRSRLKHLESLLARVQLPLKEAFQRRMDRQLQEQEEASRKKQFEQATQDHRARVQGLNPRVPPGAIFIALVPAGNSPQERGVVDDWTLIERIVQQDPELRGMTMERVQLLPGEDVVGRARRIAQGYEEPGRQLTIGISLGVLPEEKARGLYDVWPREQIDTRHPLLALSFIYTPAEALEAEKGRGRVLVPSISSQFAAWARSGEVGLIRDLPDVALPLELWNRFERKMREQAGLEQAA